MALIESTAVIVVVTLTAANPAAATKRAGAPVKNTIQCSAFKKMPDGTWYVEGPTTFRIGTFKKTTFTQQSIGPDFFTFGRADLYKVLEGKCSAPRERRRGDRIGSTFAAVHMSRFLALNGHPRHDL
jgi:hypothetical protein